jgi:hypothetical protein
VQVRDGAVRLSEMSEAERSARLGKVEAATLSWGRAVLARGRSERVLMASEELAEENRTAVALEVLYRYASFVVRWGSHG